MRGWPILALLCGGIGGCDFDEMREPQRPPALARGEDPEYGHHHGYHGELGHAVRHGPVSPEAAARVMVIDSPTLERETEALGVVDAHEPGGAHDAACSRSSWSAASLGADAVIGVEFHHGEMHGEPTHLSGLAVRFRRLRRDQPYATLARLDVPCDMHEEEVALRELKRRARVLGADLIIDIDYEHGEGGGREVHLYGTAIRYLDGDERGSTAGASR
jgi:uncharacterized protein YbjQ (UPF0145 family)